MWVEWFNEKVDNADTNDRLITEFQKCPADAVGQHIENELNDDFELNLMLKASKFWISQEITNEYIKIIKEKFPEWIDLKKMVWEKIGKEVFWNADIWYLTIEDLLPYFNLMKEYPDDCQSLMEYLWYIQFWIYNDDLQEYTPVYVNFDHADLDSYIIDYFKLLKQYWAKNMIDYLKYCWPTSISYMRKWSHIVGNKYLEWDVGSRESRSFVIHFFELFWEEPEAWNLFNYLSNNPQKLDNLWWKEIKTIDLDIKYGVNFCFRGILEMVKSRPDINFPHLSENPTEEERKNWENEWNKIIREYENLLRNYIAKDFEIEWRNKTFDKIFYTSPLWDAVLDDSKFTKESLQNFSENQVADYSFQVDKSNQDGELIQKWESKEDIRKGQLNMIEDMKEYVLSHPNEKVLICVLHHWNPDWSSWNEWNKEDWIKLANISPNIKIFSIRCLFWSAYENKDIYNNSSAVSWFSNKSVTADEVTKSLNYALEKWVWFNEMELMARMNYTYSVAPLTENITYTNWNTWESEIWNIWLASNDRIQTNPDLSDVS